MNSEQLDLLLDLIQPAPQSADERDHLRAALEGEIAFLQFALGSRSAEDVHSERVDEVERIRSAGNALLNLPSPWDATYKPLGKRFLRLATEMEWPLDLLQAKSKGRGRPHEDQRYFFMKRCVSFLKDRGKKASMHASGSGTKFVKCLWDLLRPTDKIGLGGWAIAWRRYTKAAETLPGANPQGDGA